MKIPLLAVLTCFLAGCAGQHVSEIPEAVRIGVYAETDAIHAGRYDLAEKYGDNLLRIVPAPKVRPHFAPVLRKPDVSSPTAAPERINVVPLDAANLTLRATDVPDLLDTPGAVAAQAAADAFARTVDKQQEAQASQASHDAAQVEKDRTTIAGMAKWKWMVIMACSVVVLIIVGYFAWKLKWFGI